MRLRRFGETSITPIFNKNMPALKKPYQEIEALLKELHPAMPTHAEICEKLKREKKWVSNNLAALKKLGLAEVHGRAQWARWRLTSMQYEGAKTNAADIFKLDPNAAAYGILAAMQQVARNRLMTGARL